eukprot:scaffold11.g3881.t1
MDADFYFPDADEDPWAEEQQPGAGASGGGAATTAGADGWSGRQHEQQRWGPAGPEGGEPPFPGFAPGGAPAGPGCATPDRGTAPPVAAGPQGTPLDAQGCPLAADGPGQLQDCHTTTGGVRTALLHNTLVCLPTGLGKTLIAAVVMHNFTRWFPEGKVVFVAPTRPLVAQQVEACYNFMGLSKREMAELTGEGAGSTKVEARREQWVSPHVRIFFCTPQTFWNDVRRGVCPYEQLVCLVVDECHRATGNYDIVNAVKHMRERKCRFRVLGLSATPGADGARVQQEVLGNLMIARIEFRNEQDSEVAPYVHGKDVQVHVVQPSLDAQHIMSSLLHLLRDCIARLFNGAPRAAEHACRLTRALCHVSCLRCLLVAGLRAVAGHLLAQTREQLEKYGVQTAYAFYSSKMGDAAWRPLQGNPVYNTFRQQLEGAAHAGRSSPKMAKLIEVLRMHFQASAGDASSEGRVIIFTNYRDGVQSIVDSCRHHQPLITARWGAKEQKAVLADFREGKFNVLVATCIGEEGLDIPAVDLIVCFDATSSPTRAIQRMGRTGRHREGRIVYLLAQGREHEQYLSIEDNMRKLHAKLRQPGRHFDLLPPQKNPRMLPREPADGMKSGRGGRGSGRGRGAGAAASGRGGGSGRGRSRGRGKASSLAVLDEEDEEEGGAGGGLEPVAEAADQFEQLAGAGGRAARQKKLQRRAAAEAVLIESEDEEGGGDDVSGGGGPAPEAAVQEPSADSMDWLDGADDLCAPFTFVAGPGDGSPAGPSSPSPSAPGEDGAGAGAAGGEEPHARNPSPPWPVAHRLLFPQRTGNVVRWDAQGRLRVAAPPSLDSLLAELAAVPAGAAAGEQAGGSEQQRTDAACSTGGPGVVTPQRPPVQLPLLDEEGLLLPGQATSGEGPRGGGTLLRFDDPSVHRWAFLAALTAQPRPQAEDAGAASPPPLQEPAPAAAGAATAAKKPAKAAKPRKRKEGAAEGPPPKSKRAKKSQAAARGAATDPAAVGAGAAADPVQGKDAAPMAQEPAVTAGPLPAPPALLPAAPAAPALPAAPAPPSVQSVQGAGEPPECVDLTVDSQEAACLFAALDAAEAAAAARRAAQAAAQEQQVAADWQQQHQQQQGQQQGQEADEAWSPDEPGQSSEGEQQEEPPLSQQPLARVAERLRSGSQLARRTSAGTEGDCELLSMSQLPLREWLAQVKRSRQDRGEGCHPPNSGPSSQDVPLHLVQQQLRSQQPGGLLPPPGREEQQVAASGPAVLEMVQACAAQQALEQDAPPPAAADAEGEEGECLASLKRRLRHGTAVAAPGPAATKPAAAAEEQGEVDAVGPSLSDGGSFQPHWASDGHNHWSWQEEELWGAAPSAHKQPQDWSQSIATASPACLVAGPPQERQPLRRLRKHGGALASAPAGAAGGRLAAPAAAGGARPPQCRRDGPRGPRKGNRLRSSRFVDVEADLSGDDDSGDEEEGEDGDLAGFVVHGEEEEGGGGGGDATPSTGRARYRRGLPGMGPSPSPLGLLFRRRGGVAAVQDTPGASQDEEEYEEDSFIDDGSEPGTQLDAHDNACLACGGEEGELLLCEGCPAVAHPACCGLLGVPSGDWLCGVCADAATPAAARARQRQRSRLQQTTAKTAGGGGDPPGSARPTTGHRPLRPSRLGQQQQQQQQQAKSGLAGAAGASPQGAAAGACESEDNWGDSDDSAPSPNFELL